MTPYITMPKMSRFMYINKPTKNEIHHTYNYHKLPSTKNVNQSQLEAAIISNFSTLSPVDITPLKDIRSNFTLVNQKSLPTAFTPSVWEKFTNETYKSPYQSSSSSTFKPLPIKTSTSIDSTSPSSSAAYPTTINSDWKKLWTREIVKVNVLNASEALLYDKNDFYGNSTKSGESKTMNLELTSPIIAIWTYKLARALSEGNPCNIHQTNELSQHKNKHTGFIKIKKPNYSLITLL